MKHIPQELYKWQDKYFERKINYFWNLYYRCNNKDLRLHLLRAFRGKKRLKRALKNEKTYKQEYLTSLDFYSCMYKGILRLF